MIQQKCEQPSLWYLIKQFIHFRRFAFTIFLPLMGAATAMQHGTLAQILFIVATVFQFHIFTYVLNDVIDLPVDRLMAKRADHPLVRNDITSKTALIIALIQVPLLLITIWYAEVSRLAFAALLMAIVCMAVYDIWGKRLAFPPITDFIQALSWGSLTMYGAWVVGNPSLLTFILVAIFVVFILLMNGVFEGVIDIEGDSAAGLKTTAIVFGAKPRGSMDLPFIPISLLIYCIVLETLLSALNVAPLVRNDFDYSLNGRIIILTIVVVLNVAIVWLSIQLIIPSEKFRKRIRDEHIDLISAFSILILLVSYVPYLEPQFIIAILICTILPMIL
jgi:4-hydroxybenzoate polyprenyltransferase